LDPDGNVFKIVKFATDVTDQVLARQKAVEVGIQVDQNLEKIRQDVGLADQQVRDASSASGRTLETVQSVASAAEELDASARGIAQSMSLSRKEVERAKAEADATGASAQ